MEELSLIKRKYFASQFVSFRNFINFEHIILPNGMEPENFLDWEKEKQDYLNKEHVEIEGIATVYQRNIINRIDAATQLLETVMQKLSTTLEPKEIKDLTATLKSTSEVIDKSMELLKVSGFKATKYEKNATEINEKLKQISFWTVV